MFYKSCTGLPQNRVAAKKDNGYFAVFVSKLFSIVLYIFPLNCIFEYYTVVLQITHYQYQRGKFKAI